MAHDQHMRYIRDVGYNIQHTEAETMNTMPQRVEKQNMVRKPIMMPLELIEKVDAIAREREESFAAVVREAVDAYEPETIDTNEEAMINSALDLIVKSNLETIKKIDELEKRLDETHKILTEAK